MKSQTRLQLRCVIALAYANNPKHPIIKGVQTI